MAAFWEGVLAGYGIAIPVGAIGILIVDISLRKGFVYGFAAGAGAATADLIYACLAVLAGAALAIALAPYATGLRLASGLVLLILGGYGLWQVNKSKTTEQSITKDDQDRGRVLTYMRFLGLTLLNPLTVAYFAALILGREADSNNTTLAAILFVLGASLASLSWQTFLAGIGAFARQHLSPKFRTYASIFGNLVIITLGLRIIALLIRQ
jgi:threonine/homoserine/homoserine lactone efflux protein